MAYKTKSYGTGDPFVSGGAFAPVPDPGQTKGAPAPDNIGPKADLVWTGSAFGDVRHDDGARPMIDETPRFKSVRKKGHLPENA